MPMSMPLAPQQRMMHEPDEDDSQLMQAPSYVPPHAQGSPLKTIALTLLVVAVLGGAGWMAWQVSQPPVLTSATLENAQETSEMSPTSPSPPEAITEPEVRRAVAATPAETAEALEPPPDAAVITKAAKSCIDDLFVSKDAAKRLNAVHEGTKHAAQIESLLGIEAAKKPTLNALASVKGLVRALAGTRSGPLFYAVTTGCPEGALIRLLPDEAGTYRLDWPLLWDSHQQVLTAAITAKPEEPASSWALIKPSHGFELPAEQRSRYLAFQLLLTAKPQVIPIAIVDRETPLGRFFDSKTEWGQSYLAKLLLRREPSAASVPVFLVISCEGAESEASR
jgi:hypothetical protein